MAEVLSVGIVGAGKGGEQFLNLLASSSLAKVMFVCDPNVAAPGMQRASKLGIMTIKALEPRHVDSVDYIFEVTGSAKVLEILRSKVPVGKLIDNRTAYFLFSVLAEANAKNSQQVEKEFQDVKAQMAESTKRTGDLLNEIGNVVTELNIVGLNMSIEAGRLGQQGASFRVIAEKVQESVLSVKNMAQEISKMNAGMINTVETLENAQKRLTHQNLF